VAGSQGTGNFRDLGVDFGALGVDGGDVVRIANSGYHGYFHVLARRGPSLLSLDIPDATLNPTVGLRYVVLPRELLLGHDAVNLKREHVRRLGTTFLAPTLLNVKTDADLAGLSDADVGALVLVDANNVGHEVQPITAARVDVGELGVQVAPPLGPRSHGLSSAAVRRSAGGLVSDALSI
jgi:hypothetical protein